MFESPATVLDIPALPIDYAIASPVEQVPQRPFIAVRLCGNAAPDEIIICARRDQDRYRLYAEGRTYGPDLRRAFGVQLAPNIWLGGGGVRGGLSHGAGFTLTIRF